MIKDDAKEDLRNRFYEIKTPSNTSLKAAKCARYSETVETNVIE